MTTTIDHAAFIRASEAEATGFTSPLKRAHRRVLEQPGDDTARLWYADELDAVGEGERAEFIRLQLKLADLDAYIDDMKGLVGAAMPMLKALRRREGELWDRHKGEWFGERWAILNLDRKREDTDRVIDTTHADIRRGFVSRIECTLAQFMGGECPNCESFLLSGYYHSECTCHGTGRTPGLVDTLFSEQPVTEVVITGSEPYATSTGCWRWFSREGDGLHFDVPQELFELIYPMWPPPQRGPETHFETREAALLALIAACVSLGRRRAGLPELKPTEVNLS